MIVGVDQNCSAGSTFPCHYVLVWGKRNGEWLIADPWPTIPSTVVPQPRLKLSDWGHYITRGYVIDPTNLGGFDVATVNDVQIMLTSPSGQRTGFDPATGSAVQDEGAFFTDSLSDDAETGFATQRSHFIMVPQPADGQYTLAVTGLKLGSFSVDIHSYSSVGSIQPVITVSGVASPGSTSSFAVQVKTAPGATSTVIRLATTTSALSDIQNSLRLKLIKNAALAGVLIKLLQDVNTAEARGNCVTVRAILRVFTFLVKATSPKLIDPQAVKILLEDVSYLLNTCERNRS